ncbi:hypothetical protein EGT49_04620 [Companilactobacillus suantsaicola]|uniref:Uncharacterized protein n=1 Tax=Companilactobacillus suantsaicola TaxID=2487723 RepID=A0A4Z0JM06_9LACO|nr:hypothetical protein EGT49_04620 [Companilactobacillus suantsaicola]
MTKARIVVDWFHIVQMANRSAL